MLEISPETASIPPEPASEARPKPNGKVRLLSLGDLDSRTRSARHAHEIKGKIIADLGGEAALSTLQLMAVDVLAVGDAMVKDLSVRWLKGEQVDPVQIATIANMINRTADKVGWHRQARDVPSLSEYLKSRDAA